MPKLDYHKHGGINLPDQVAQSVKSRAKSKATVAWLLYVSLALWIATQLLAWRLQFSSALNADHLWGPLYYPWAGVGWAWRFWSAPLSPHVHAMVVQAVVVSGGAFALLFILSILLARADYRRHIRSAPPIHDVEGSAHWMTEEDVGETEMLPPGNPAIAKAIARARRMGKRVSWRAYDSIAEWSSKPCVLIGDWIDDRGKHNWLRDVSNGHVALFAPTRTGKGCSFVLPTCFTWNGSLVVNDPKGELFSLSAWYRKNVLKQRIFRIDPLCADGTATCINPLDWVRIGTEYEVADAQNLAELICDPLGLGLETGGDSDHWRKTSYAFLTGAILHILYDPAVKDKSLTGLDQFLSSGSLKTTLEHMINTVHDPTGVRGWVYDNKRTHTNPTVTVEARDMLNKDERERASVMSSVKSYFQLYRDPIAARNLRKSDFSLEDIMRSDRPVTIYVNVNPDNMERVRPFIRLFYNVLVKKFTGKLDFDEGGVPIPRYSFPLLLLMDELTSTLGKMPILANAVTFLAGYGIKLFLVAQNLSHLAEPYGEKVAQSILANMRIQIYFGNNDIDTCKRVSTMLGDATVRTESTNWDGGKKKISEGFKGRALLRDDEIRKFDPNKEIVVITGLPPGKFDRINIDYQDPYFKSLQHSPVEADGSPLVLDLIPPNERAIIKELAPLREQAAMAARQRVAESEDAKAAAPASREFAAVGAASGTPSAVHEDLDDDDHTNESLAGYF